MNYFLLCFFLALHCVELKPLFDPVEILYNYDFLKTTDPDPAVLKAAIKKFQKINKLKQTGTVNSETLEKLTAPRCGGPSNVPQFSVQTKDIWRNRNLTYKIQNHTKVLSRSDVSATFQDAVAAWLKNVNLQLTETTSDNSDIKIYFSEQDGPSEELGYAYYPEIGQIFFDKDEMWTIELPASDSEIYFGWVAAHELGHALGVPHTESMNSVMYPYYSTTVTNAVESDVTLLRALYGEAVLNNSNLCSGTSIDAVLGGDEKIWISGKQYFIFSKGVIASGPYSLDRLYPNLPDKIDAAFAVGSTRYFLSNNVYYKFKRKSKKPLTKLISAGFNNLPSNISAAFYHPGATTIYFFKDRKYYALNTKLSVSKRLIVNGKDISNDWEGIPKNIDAVTLLDNSHVLFIKDTMCYRFDLNSKQLIDSVTCLQTIYKCDEVM